MASTLPEYLAQYGAAGEQMYWAARESGGQSAAFIAEINKYNQQHTQIVGSSGTMQQVGTYADGTPAYQYTSGASQGQMFTPSNTPATQQMIQQQAQELGAMQQGGQLSQQTVNSRVQELARQYNVPQQNIQQVVQQGIEQRKQQQIQNNEIQPNSLYWVNSQLEKPKGNLSSGADYSGKLAPELVPGIALMNPVLTVDTKAFQTGEGNLFTGGQPYRTEGKYTFLGAATVEQHGGKETGWLFKSEGNSYFLAKPPKDTNLQEVPMSGGIGAYEGMFVDINEVTKQPRGTVTMLTPAMAAGATVTGITQMGTGTPVDINKTVLAGSMGAGGGGGFGTITPASTIQPGTVGTTGISTYFVDMANAIKSTPVLGSIYGLGESVPQGVKDTIRNVVTTAPVLSSVAQGGNVFELKAEAEKVSSVRGAEIEALAPGYTTELASYNTRVESYNQQISGYEKNKATYEANKTESGYAALSLQYNQLQTEKSTLDTTKAALEAKQSVIDTKLADITSAQDRYGIAAGNITGNVEQKQLLTYGVGSFIGDIGKGYQTLIAEPYSKAVKPYFLGDVATGLVNTPTQVATIGQSILIGGETIVRDIGNTPGLVAAGLAMQAKGTYELAVTSPGELVGTVVGMLLLGEAVSAVSTRAIGLARSAGQEYVPIESIGYSPEGRYPLNPVQSESALARSFAEGKLYPAPKAMAEPMSSGSTAVPYLHGENGIPVARLPNAQAGETTLFSALDSSSRSRLVPEGTAYKLITSGGSEVQGMYGAPIAESYFAKVGGIVPKLVGVELPFKTPTIYSTVTEGVEAVAKGVRENLPRNAEGDITDWSGVNRYIQLRSTEVPAGQGYMPLLKAEYEAIIPDNTIIEVTGRNYYTKLGGIGESHFLGIRVPIVEQRSIGFEPSAEMIDGITSTAEMGKEYSTLSQRANLLYLSPVSSAVVASTVLATPMSVTSQQQTGISRASAYRTEYPSSVGSMSATTKTAVYQSHASSYATQSSASLARSSYSAFGSSVFKADSYNPEYSDRQSIAQSPPLSSEVYGASSLITPKQPISSYLTPSYTPKPSYTPPSSYVPPSSTLLPTQITPPIPIPPLPFPGLPASSRREAKKDGKSRKFVNIFLYGQGIGNLDFGFRMPRARVRQPARRIKRMW